MSSNLSTELNKKEIIVTIKRGPSFDFFYIGLILIVAGIALASELSLVCLLIAVAGVPILLSKKGIQFDVTNRRRRNYYRYFGLKIGNWYTYPEDDELWLTKRSSRNSGLSNFQRVVTSDIGFTYWFDITVASSMGDIEILEFNDYFEAKKEFEYYAGVLNMKSVDDYGNSLIERGII